MSDYWLFVCICHFFFVPLHADFESYYRMTKIEIQ